MRRVLLGAAAALLAPAAGALASVPAQSGSVALLTQANVAITGTETGAQVGYSVRGAGDVNRDGIDDLVVSAPMASPLGRSSAGATYVIFGSRTQVGVSLPALGSQGFSISGAATGDNAGFSAGAAGDVNGDGYADVIVGAPNAALGAGQALVVLGSAAPVDIDLASPGARVMTITGAAAPDSVGWWVDGAGDVNGDGLADVVVGAALAGGGAGAAYVVYGTRSAASVNLGALGAQGFRMDGGAIGDLVGAAVAGTGDVNGDGHDDVMVGSPYVGGAGAAYVVFGGPAHADVNLGALGSGGLTITGATALGASLDGAGDVNADGIDDVIVGTPTAAGGNGQSFIIFGSPASGTIDVGTMSQARGVRLEGNLDNAGNSVAGAGDLNGDGIDDVLIGGPSAAGGDGRAYAVYGTRTWSDRLLAGMTPQQGFTMNGGAGGGAGGSVAGAGDVNGDGRPDAIVGVSTANTSAGAAYVVDGFGTPSVAYPSAVTGQVGVAIAPLTPKLARTGTATFSVAPALPEGLSLDTATGVIRGTPRDAADGTYTVTMTDWVGTASSPLAITVTAASGPTAASAAPTLAATWRVRGHTAAVRLGQLAGATNYGLVARRGGTRVMGRCVVPRAAGARVACTVRLAPGRWSLTAVAAAGRTRMASATHVVAIRAAATPVTG